jgi:hypothetical protein
MTTSAAPEPRFYAGVDSLGNTATFDRESDVAVLFGPADELDVLLLALEGPGATFGAVSADLLNAGHRHIEDYQLVSAPFANALPVDFDYTFDTVPEEARR